MTITKGEWIDRRVRAWFEAERTNAYRLCTVNGGWVERFASDILISYQNQTTGQRLTTELQIRRGDFGFLVRRIFARVLPKRNEERSQPQLIHGDPVETCQTIVTERGVNYGIDFKAGYSAGLFLDQRENRSFVGRLGIKRLLNCFAYTCSFSVAAAAAGAQTVNVDLSKKWLARGRQNFRLNDLELTGHRFIQDDVRPVLRRMAARGEKFDAIILDPPTFAHAPRGKPFHVENEFAELIARSLQVAAGKAWILLSTNCSSLRTATLQNICTEALKTARRTAKFRYPPQLPDFPSDTGARALWVSLD
jgi:23S rRNA (cytosine1962-C5)-methyltransferase